MNFLKPPSKPLGWVGSVSWLVVGVGCFNLAYTSVKHPGAGLFIFGYALALVHLSNQPSVRRALGYGRVFGLLCFVPQTFFFWKIFSVGAIALWLILAYWVVLFMAIICGSLRRWGAGKTMWLVPIVWTGLEYFRSELYYLKFSWLNIGYAFSGFRIFSFGVLGMYGIGFLVFAVVSALVFLRPKIGWSIVALVVGLVIIEPHFIWVKEVPPRISLVGIQLEFPPKYILTTALDSALKKNPDGQIFVFSEYTLEGAVPDSLKDWCRKHSRFLVVGGKDYFGYEAYYNTAYVVGTNGEIVFKQAKCVPIQFMQDGKPAPEQKVWDSPWGKIGICICYDLSYTRVTDELVRQGAQLLIVPTMDVAEWGRRQHEMHSRVALVRAAEYGIPIFRLASSGISQAVTGDGNVVAKTTIGGIDEILAARLPLAERGSLPWDRFLAPVCVFVTGIVSAGLLFFAWKERRVAKRS